MALGMAPSLQPQQVGFEFRISMLVGPEVQSHRRQLVNHRHVLVNGQRVNIPSYTVRDGDTIELTAKAKEMPLVLEAARSGERDVPDYIEIDHDRMRGRFIRAPKPTDVPFPVSMEPNLVIEFYSR